MLTAHDDDLGEPCGQFYGASIYWDPEEKTRERERADRLHRVEMGRNNTQPLEATP